MARTSTRAAASRSLPAWVSATSRAWRSIALTNDTHLHIIYHADDFSRACRNTQHLHRSTSRDALELLSDAQRLPDWAPAFARAVEPAGPDWLIDSGGSQLRIHVRVSLEYGTVDLLRPEDPGRGARMRVLPNEDGSVLLFTLGLTT
jgi:hypothetical protein